MCLVLPGDAEAVLAVHERARLLERRADDLVEHVCEGSKETIELPRRAFSMPTALLPLASQLSSVRRAELRSNPHNLSATALTESVAHLDTVDVDNNVTVPPRIDREVYVGELNVAELNAERGRFWCEFALQIRSTPELRRVDIWLLNEFDIGMARSKQQHTARLLAYALGMNYAWATEFVELSSGNKAEQQRVKGEQDRYGLHGNALLSRWPILKPAVVRMPGMDSLYSSKSRDTAYGYEKRLGGRMTLFATSGPAGDVVIGATHAQTFWFRDATHTQESIRRMRTHIANMAPAAAPVLIGGDTWANTCRWLDLSSIVEGRSPTNRVNASKVILSRGGNDDYICARKAKLVDKVQHLPCVGRPPRSSGEPEFVLSDHVFVTAKVRIAY